MSGSPFQLHLHTVPSASPSDSNISVPVNRHLANRERVCEDLGAVVSVSTGTRQAARDCSRCPATSIMGTGLCVGVRKATASHVCECAHSGTAAEDIELMGMPTVH